MRFVACLIAQGMCAADINDALPDSVLGSSIDLLVWIPKTPGAGVPNDLRPLQLPTRFRRLFGAAIAGIVGPIIEPALCPDQAAISGGQGGPNIAEANTHLTSPTGPDPAPGATWRALIGDDHDVVEEHIQGIATDLAPAPCNAAWFADQNKAFERVAMHWAARTLHRWGFPTWLQRSLLCLCQKRAVQILRGSYKGAHPTAAPQRWDGRRCVPIPMEHVLRPCHRCYDVRCGLI